MSRLTATQVISLGEYLEPDFDPTSLTVSQLLGVLGFHNIQYPTPYTKGKLVQLFTDQIKPRSSKLKKNKIKQENSAASDDGIVDGVTGEPLNGKGKALTRRSSRRLTNQVPQPDQDGLSTRPEPAKPRRSSAQPILGGTSRRAIPTVTLIEESEEEEVPAKKVGRSKKISTAGTRARRVSHVSGEESGWEDNNIFQSGAESSSPVRPTLTKPRVSKVARKSRKSMSAPPQISDSSSPLRKVLVSPPQSPFHPVLPSSPDFEPQPPSRSRFTPVPVFHPIQPIKREAISPVHVEETITELSEPSSQEVTVKAESTEFIAPVALQGETEPLQPSSQIVQSPLSIKQISARFLVWCLIASFSYATWNYKVESASIGFCDRGSRTNQALEATKIRRAAGVDCNRDGQPTVERPSLENPRVNITESCPLPPLLPFPAPSSCTLCPEHGTCTQHSVTCDTGFLLKPPLLLSFVPVLPSQTSLDPQFVPALSNLLFKGFSSIFDGLFDSIAFPPRCVEDPNRRRHIGNLGKAVEARLAKERGRRVCRGDRVDPSDPDESTEEAIKWGVEIGVLEAEFKKSANPALIPVFDEMFNEAIQQLTQWGGVFMGESSDGTRHIAHKTPFMSWDCMLLVKSRKLWDAWRPTVLGSILVALVAMVIRARVTLKQKESKRIAELVQVALDTLRNQELAHYTDPVNAPEPYLSSIQLRDLVLQDEHSVNTRRKLWEKVEGVVESNANVRANLEEIEGGDELRVWRWVGNTGRTPGRKDLEA